MNAARRRLILSAYSGVPAGWRPNPRPTRREMRSYDEENDPPHYGGMLDLAHGRRGHCCACDYRGAATVIDGVIQTHCPVCEREPDPPTKAPPPPPRKAAKAKAKRRRR